MKREAIGIVATLGFVLLGAAVILGLITGILFIFPKASFFGARSVNERDTQVIYCDDDLVDAFANGRFILESNSTKVEVKMSNNGYDGQNTIVVNESATGIAFNNINRTLIEWTQTSYNNQLYYRIKILEPSGMVFTQKPTTVYINLPYRNDGFRYDFVLQNQYSSVDFSFVDMENATDALLINDLVVESAGNVNVAYNEKSSVKNVKIKGNKTKVTCKAKVENDVLVTGSNNVLDFGYSNEVLAVGGNITIQGNNNQFRGTLVSGNVSFKQDSGLLKVYTIEKSLDVETVNAPINVTEGVLGNVTMKTQSGKLQVDKLVKGNVVFDTINGNLEIDAIHGNLNFTAGTPSEPNATASVNVKKLLGAATVYNYGIGSISLSDVTDDVTINSYQVGGGKIDVDLISINQNVNILGYDGEINVRGINGGDVNITILGERERAGAANINTQFKNVGTAEIRSGGYISGHDDWGNVNVTLSENCNDLDMYVYFARSANSSSRFAYATNNMKISRDENDSASAKNRITVKGSDVGSLKIYSQNKVYLS